MFTTHKNIGLVKGTGTFPKVSAIITVFNRWSETELTLNSISASDYTNLNIIVVDSGSTDGTLENIKKYDVTYLRISDDIWWAGAANTGIRHALDNGADYLLFVDCGIAVMPNTISKMIGVASESPRCLLAASLIDANTNHLIWVGKRLHWLFPLYRFNLNNRKMRIRKVGSSSLVPTDNIFGRVTLVKSSYFDEVGLFRDNIFPHYHTDIDWSISAKEKGFELYVQLDAQALLSHVPQVPARLLRKDTYFDRRSDVNFRDTWFFFKYCSPYKNIYPLLFIAFYVEFAFGRLRGIVTSIFKRILSDKMVSRFEKYRRNQEIIGVCILATEDYGRFHNKK